MMKKMTGKSFALSALVAASFMAAGAMASDKTEPRNEVYKDKFANQYASWHDTDKSTENTDVLASDPSLVVLWAGYGFAKITTHHVATCMPLRMCVTLCELAHQPTRKMVQCLWLVGAVRALMYLA